MKLPMHRYATGFGLDLGAYHMLLCNSCRLSDGQINQKTPLDFDSGVLIVNDGKRLSHPKTASSGGRGLLEHCYCSIHWKDVCTPEFGLELF